MEKKEKEKKVHFGIIGCGSIVKLAHVRAFKDNKDKAEIVATCDVKEEWAKKVANELNAKAWYTDYQDLLKRDDIDAVLVATPHNVHCEQVIASAEAGKHVYVEKPMACTNVEAWAMVKACKEANVQLLIGCNQRFWPQSEIARQLVEEGAIGEPKHGRTSLHEHWSMYQDRIAYTDYRRKSVEAGASIFDLGAHRVDLLRYLMGDKEAKRVVGISKRIATPKEYANIDDIGIIIIEFEDNTYGSVSLNRISRAVSNITELYGTEGTMFVSSEAFNPFQSAPIAILTDKYKKFEDLPDVIQKYRYPQFYFMDDLVTDVLPRRWVAIYPPREWSYSRMMAHFIGCLWKGEKPRVSGEEGAKATEILVAVFKSMETNQWVDLPLKEEIVPPGYKPYRPPAEYL